MKRQQGMGLPELLVGFFLSTLLMMITIQHVLHVQQQSQVIFAVIEESLELEWVADFIRSRVRAAGFTPCRRVDHLECFDARIKPEPLIAIDVSTGRDARLTIRRMTDHYATVIQQRSSTEILIDAPLLKIDQPVLMSDCYHAEIHEVARVIVEEAGVVVTLKEPLLFRYELPAYMGEWVSESFFIRANVDGGRALYYQHHRVDKLTARIHAFSAQMYDDHGYLFVHLLLQMENARTWVLDTRVRTP